MGVATWGRARDPSGVTAQGAVAWQRGYEVSMLSYDAPDGRDVAPVTDAPPIPLDVLREIVTSDVWFE